MAEVGFLTALKFIGERALEIAKQPLINTEMLWILLPLLTALLLMELYFGRYKKEELGWNSAVSNSIILFFVGMNLCSFLYSKNMLIGLTVVPSDLVSIAAEKTFIALILILESISLIVLNFFHLVSRKFAFGISSALIMNFIGVISVVLVYSNIHLDMITIPAILLLFIIMVAFFSFLKIIEPKGEESEEEAEEKELEELEEELEEVEEESLNKIPSNKKYEKKRKRGYRKT